MIYDLVADGSKVSVNEHRLLTLWGRENRYLFLCKDTFCW